jgi:MFS family permease
MKDTTAEPPQATASPPVRAYLHRIGGLNRNVKLYLLAVLLRSATFALFELFFNFYILSLGFDAAFIGLASTLLGIASLICSLPGGLVADRIGRKRAMLIGLAGILITHFGVALSSQRWTIAAFYILYGMLAPLFFASSAPFLTENSTGDERAILFTLSSSLMNLAWFVMTIAGGYLPGVFAGLLNVEPESAAAYRAVLLTASCGMTVALVPILFLSEERRSRRRVRAARPLAGQFSSPALLVKLVLPRILFAFGAGLFFPFLTLFFKQRFGVTDAVLGWIIGITSAVAALTMLVGGPIAERLGKIQAMFYSRLISTPLLLVIGFAPTLPLAVAAHWIRSGFMRIGQPLYVSFAMEQLEERERATGSSVLTMGWDAGWSLGPLVSGLVQTRTGYTPLIVATTVFYALGLGAVYGFFVRPARRPTVQ